MELESSAHQLPLPFRGDSLRIAGLFAGIGGFELGMHRAGHSTELLCEVEPAAQSVLRERFSREVIPDVRDIGSLPEQIDVVCAGFPCQDVSSSGQKEGMRGKRTSLIEEVFRMLRRRQVEWVVLENVPFMLHLKKGETIRAVVDGLENLGYSWAYRTVDSASFGVPQRRRRVFIVASLHSDPRAVLLSDDAPRKTPEPILDEPIGFYWTEGRYSTGLAANSVPPLKGGSTIGIPSPPAVLFPNGLAAKPHVRDAERLQGFPAGWTEPAIEVTRRSARWKLIGNAVTVNAAEWLGRQLVDHEKYDAKEDLPFPDEVKEGRKSWPDAAWGIGGERFVSTASTHPISVRNGGLDGFLKDEPTPLSERATKGFLSRATAGNLNYPEGFLDALATYVETLHGSKTGIDRLVNEAINPTR